MGPGAGGGAATSAKGVGAMAYCNSKVAVSKSDLLYPYLQYPDLVNLRAATLVKLIELHGGEVVAKETKKAMSAKLSILISKSGDSGGAAGGISGGDAGGESGAAEVPGGDDGGGAGDGDGGAGGDDSDPDDEQDDGNDDWDKDVFFGIGVKLPGGELISFLVEANDNLHYVKGIIRDKKGIPRCHQRLTLEGLPASDDDKVIRGATYEVLMRIAGGVKGVKNVKKTTA